MIGHVYRIIHLESDIQYVGSTFSEPRKRWQQHKSSCQQSTKGNHSNVSIYEYMLRHGLDKFKLIPIKSYEVADRKGLEAFEQIWINKLKCVNVKASFNPIMQSSRLANRLRSQKHQCECGGSFNDRHRTRHIQTQKHKRWLESQ